VRRALPPAGTQWELRTHDRATWHARCSTRIMPPLTPRNDEPTDYEQLRNHLARPRIEHPAARQHDAAPVPPDAERVSVMEWLFAVGKAVARRLRRAPRSAMVRLHPPE
jgi:hypothetical protein